MSFLYDELKALSKQNGKSFARMAHEMNIPPSTVNKWRVREPHPKYKDRIIQYIDDERMKFQSLKKPMFPPNITRPETGAPAVPIEYDENHVPTDFWKKLEDIYLSHADGKDNWANEKDRLKAIVPELARAISKRDYIILSPIDHGGNAVILKVRDEKLGVDRALKFPRPIEKHQDLFNETIGTEIGYLLEAHHRNVVEIYFRDEIELSFGTFPLYIMKYVRGAQSAHQYFSAKRTAQDLIRVLKGAVAGVKHLHSLGIVHFDIKPNNILVSEDGEALLSDLGSARRYDESDDEVSIIYTKRYAHPKLIALRSQSTSDSNRNRGFIKRKDIEPAFDIYAFGKSLFELVQSFDPNIVTERMRPYERKYLLLMAARSLDGQNTDQETALGLPRDAFRELRYRSFNDISNDFDKLTGEFPLHTLLPELNPYILETVQAGSNWKTPLSHRLVNLLAHPSMQRLAGVSELGLLIHIYPTATHTRLQHSLGVFSNTIRIIEALYNDPINPLFKQIMTVGDLKCLLLSALFHDMGHFPLAHDIHEALPSIFDHESVAVSVLRGEKAWFSANTLRDLIQRDWSVNPNRIAGIIKLNPSDTTQPIKDRVLNTIINGPIDADKLDYLIRDARTLDIPYASVIDLERLLSCLTIIFRPEGVRTYAALGIHEKGRVSAEAVAFARYAMFGAVYWHHAFRAIKAMLHRAVWETRLHKYPGPNGEFNLQNEFQARFFESIVSRPMWEEGPLDSMTQILPSDREILNWFFNNTSDKGKILIQMLNSRQLFKRICVISQTGRPIWQRLVDFRKNTTDCSKLVALQDRIQEDIVAFISQLTPDDRNKNSTLTVDRTDNVIQKHQAGQVLFLLDIPSGKFSSDAPLKYLPESARQSLLQNWDDPVDLEDSLLWRELNDDLIGLVGKVRLFGHPDIEAVVNAALNRETKENIIDGALGYIQTKP